MTVKAIRLFATFAVVGFALAGCASAAGPAETPSSTAGPSRGTDDITAEDLEVGDCLNDAELSGIVTEVPVVPCSEPHDSEAYAEFDLADGPYPGRDEINAQGEAGCVEAFTAFVGIPFNESEPAVQLLPAHRDQLAPGRSPDSLRGVRPDEADDGHSGGRRPLAGVSQDSGSSSEPRPGPLSLVTKPLPRTLGFLFLQLVNSGTIALLLLNADSST